MIESSLTHFGTACIFAFGVALLLGLKIAMAFPGFSRSSDPTSLTFFWDGPSGTESFRLTPGIASLGSSGSASAAAFLGSAATATSITACLLVFLQSKPGWFPWHVVRRETVLRTYGLPIGMRLLLCICCSDNPHSIFGQNGCWEPAELRTNALGR